MRKQTPPGSGSGRGLRGVDLAIAVTVLSLCVGASLGSAGPNRSGASVPFVPATHRTQPPQRSGTPSAVPTATPGQEVLAGPLDWGDPAIVHDASAFYLYSTQPLPWVNVAVEVGGSGGTWGPVHDALPTMPPWAQSGQTWSPEAHRFDGRWVLYFAAQIRGTAPAVHCIGEAIANTPIGPFWPAAVPLVCQRAQGGSIDPRVYVSPAGSPYLVWKSDNNSDPARFGPPVIWTQRLTGDGLRLLGAPTAIFTPDRAWQQSLIEAPDMVAVGGRTWLFYSAGGGFWAATYAIGVALCAGPLGPCADVGNTPLLASNAQGQGPGEPSIFNQDGRYWLVYNPSYSIHGSTARPVAIAPLNFVSGRPTVGAARST